MGSLIQPGGQGVRRRFRLPRSRHEVIGPAMLVCFLGVAAGIAMLAYGNFGRASTAQAAEGRTLKIVAPPLEASSPVPTSMKSAARRASGPSTTLALSETATPADPTSATPALTEAAESQMADDAAAAGMTARVRPGSATLG